MCVLSVCKGGGVVAVEGRELDCCFFGDTTSRPDVGLRSASCDWSYLKTLTRNKKKRNLLWKR